MAVTRNQRASRASSALKPALSALIALSVLCTASCSRHVTPPSVAGQFYPAQPGELMATVDRMLDEADKTEPEEGRLIALVSPHAGYRFSGRVAAHSYKGLKGYTTVVIIGPAHKAALRGASVYTEGAFSTPLGTVSIDEKFARRLLDPEAGVVFMPEAFEGEHSIEVQIPFLQRTLGDFRIVPVLMGSYSGVTKQHLVERLTEQISGRDDVLIVASSDLSHYHGYDTAVSMDRQAISSMKALSPGWAVEILRRGEAEMCGSSAVIVAMETAMNLGATHGILHKYANSGDVTGDRERVVGYASVGLYHAPLSEQELEMLLGVARSTIESVVRTGKPPAVKYLYPPRLNGTGGSFVTINMNGMLRGCMGEVLTMDNLMHSVIRSAGKAAISDPRFPPMTVGELVDMEVEVSVLSMPARIRPEEVEVGRHGVLLVRGNRSAIYLPRVPVEQGWDVPEYLDNLSIKAGLPGGAWRSPDTELYGFTAEVIREQ